MDLIITSPPAITFLAEALSARPGMFPVSMTFREILEEKKAAVPAEEASTTGPQAAPLFCAPLSAAPLPPPAPSHVEVPAPDRLQAHNGSFAKQEVFLDCSRSYVPEIFSPLLHCTSGKEALPSPTADGSDLSSGWKDQLPPPLPDRVIESMMKPLRAPAEAVEAIGNEGAGVAEISGRPPVECSEIAAAIDPRCAQTADSSLARTRSSPSYNVPEEVPQPLPLDSAEVIPIKAPAADPGLRRSAEDVGIASASPGQPRHDGKIHSESMAVMRPAGGEPEDLEGSHNVLIMEPTSQRVEAPNGERTIPCPREESPGDAPAGVEQSVERKQDPQVREAPAPEVKKERVHVSDLARHLLEKIGEYQKNPTVHLRLEPPGLGEVVVRITLENSRLNIHFNASTVLAGALIEESLPVLTQSCLEKGLALGSLDISSQLFNSQGQGSLYPDRGGARPPLEEAETAPAEIAVLDGAKSRKLNVIV